MQPRGITYVIFVFACSLGGLIDISKEAPYTIISIYVTLDVSYSIILSAYTTLEDMILHVFRQRGNEAPLHFIRGGPLVQLGPAPFAV